LKYEVKKDLQDYMNNTAGAREKLAGEAADW